jgi:hypothetical protein
VVITSQEDRGNAGLDSQQMSTLNEVVVARFFRPAHFTRMCAEYKYFCGLDTTSGFSFEKCKSRAYLDGSNQADSLGKARQ